MTGKTTGIERAFAWSIAIGLSVRFALPETIARFAPGDHAVLFGLIVLGLIAAMGYASTHGGVAGSLLLAVSPLLGAVGIVSIGGVVAPFVHPTIIVESGIAWELSIAFVVGLVVGGVGSVLGHGVRRIRPSGRPQSNPGTADR